MTRRSGPAWLVALMVQIDGAHEIRRPRDVMPLHVVEESVEKLWPDEGVNEIRRADLHRRGAGDHELDDVPRVGDAAHTDDGNLHPLAAFVDHPDGDRPNRGTAQAADDVRDLRP